MSPSVWEWQSSDSMLLHSCTAISFRVPNDIRDPRFHDSAWRCVSFFGAYLALRPRHQTRPAANVVHEADPRLWPSLYTGCGLPNDLQRGSSLVFNIIVLVGRTLGWAGPIFGFVAS